MVIARFLLNDLIGNEQIWVHILGFRPATIPSLLLPLLSNWVMGDQNYSKLFCCLLRFPRTRVEHLLLGDLHVHPQLVPQLRYPGRECDEIVRKMDRPKIDRIRQGIVPRTLYALQFVGFASLPLRSKG